MLSVILWDRQSVDLKTKILFTLCRNLKHCVDLHTSTHCFHELDIQNFLNKEAFWYVVFCLKMEKNIKRKDWDEIRPK